MPGELQSVDGYMNIALEKTEEYVNGRLRKSYGDAFVRGNNGDFCCLTRAFMNTRLMQALVMYISSDS